MVTEYGVGVNNPPCAGGTRTTAASHILKLPIKPNYAVIKTWFGSAGYRLEVNSGVKLSNLNLLERS